MDTTSLGNRMKTFEKFYTNQKCMPLLPVIARLDGKCFSQWTKGLERPFDYDFMEIMMDVTSCLVEGSGALIGYTQSDEITLIFYTDDPKSEMLFDGKLYKLNSVLASMCTAEFTICLDERVWRLNEEREFKKAELFASKPPGLFDCRVFQVPTKMEAVNCLVWREQDATRNSILAVGQSKFSHSIMQNKDTKQIQEMLFQEHGINWSQDFPDFAKRGSYFRKILIDRQFSPEEIKKLPPKHEAHKNPNLLIKRPEIQNIELPILSSIANKVEVIFNNAKPIIKKENESNK